MKLIEALEILQKTPPTEGDTFALGLVCGFDPSHLQTLLAAQLRLLFPERRIDIRAGLYGDFWGNLERLERGDVDAGVVILEWSDLDGRLGLRSLGSWEPTVLADILKNTNARVSQVERNLQEISSRIPLVVCFPTLPLPPISFTPGWQASAFELETRALVYSASARVGQIPSVRVVNPQRLDCLSPLRDRFDVKSEILAGFPYKLQHAAALAELLSRLIQDPAPKKGLITDLDDTLWKGIVGEAGVEGISWDLDHRSHMHGVYQKFLHALSSAGVLVGIASKNERSLVEEALGRKDLILPRSAMFPVEVDWRPKSESVSRILKTWNVGADSVVFVDDSSMELAEVKASHPAVECIQFPSRDQEGINQLLERLRDLFGKSALLEEDRIRLDTIRRAHARSNNGEYADTISERFLEQAEAELLLNFRKEPLDPRALELVNKTNQFNLNGKRYTQVSWRARLNHPDAFLLLVTYKDKYGPLGKISVLAGHQRRLTLFVDTWVMSCRAFGRRIEHRCLEELFVRFGAEEIQFDFLSTARNEPLRSFLTETLGAPPTPECRLAREKFFETRYETFHRVQEITHG